MALAALFSSHDGSACSATCKREARPIVGAGCQSGVRNWSPQTTRAQRCSEPPKPHSKLTDVTHQSPQTLAKHLPLKAHKAPYCKNRGLSWELVGYPKGMARRSTMFNSKITLFIHRLRSAFRLGPAAYSGCGLKSTAGTATFYLGWTLWFPQFVDAWFYGASESNSRRHLPLPLGRVAGQRRSFGVCDFLCGQGGCRRAVAEVDWWLQRLQKVGIAGGWVDENESGGFTMFEVGSAKATSNMINLGSVRGQLTKIPTTAIMGPHQLIFPRP